MISLPSSPSYLLPLDAFPPSSSLPPPARAALSSISLSSFDPAVHLHSGDDNDDDDEEEERARFAATRPGSAAKTSRKDGKAGDGGQLPGGRAGRHQPSNNSAGANTVGKSGSSSRSRRVGGATAFPSSQAADDDLEALRLQSAEITAAKSRQGIVIQHRAWPPEHAFRSEEDYDGIVDSPLKKRRKLSAVEASNDDDIIASFPQSFTADATEAVGILPDILESDGRVLPSSPPSLADMASLTSSSTVNPRSSSPAVAATAIASTITTTSTAAPLLANSSQPRVVAGFVVDDDDEDFNNDDGHPAALDFRAPAGGKDWLGADIFGEKLGGGGVAALSQSYNSLTQARPMPGFIHPPVIEDGGAGLPEAYGSFSFPSDSTSSGPKQSYEIHTCSGNRYQSRPKPPSSRVPFEQLIASRSAAQAGRAQRAYYGIEIHRLIDEASKESKRQSAVAAAAAAATAAEAARASPPPIPSIEHSGSGSRHRSSVPPAASRTLLWTEKYRAKRYTDLVGDERTHRSVLGWLKSWDPIVFPATARQKKQQQQQQPPPPSALAPFGNRGEARAVHRKVLLLAGPPGLGKTTLAHVCARHAGYEVVEINASDERSRDVVKGRIRECVGSQNVRAVTAAAAAATTTYRNPASAADRRNRSTAGAMGGSRPVCVIVDEVDGAYGGAGSSGDGGFISALMDLLALDQRNAAGQQQQQQQQQGSRTAADAFAGSRKKKGGGRRGGDRFRLSRPIILVCNDAYHPSLRPLRQSGLAEIVHARRPLLSQVAARVQAIFRHEGYACDGDGVRKLCEAAWGCAGSQRTAPGSLAAFFAGHAEGDLRGVLVVAEWVAGKLRAAATPSSLSSSSSLPLPSSGASVASARLTRHWVERHVLGELAHGGGAARGLGRGGAKEAVERVFLEGAGYQGSASSAHTGGAAGAAGAVVGVAEMRKRYAMRRLNELVESCGEVDRVITDCFAIYPAYPYRDDTILTKPNQAYEWLHFHDCVASRLYGAQEWELAEYQCQPVLAFHSLFATPAARMAALSSAPDYHHHHHTYKGGARTGATGASGAGGGGVAAGYNGDDDGAAALPFSGPRAEFAAREAEKHCRAVLAALVAQLPLALARSFRSPEHVATELLPYLVRLVTPNVRPVIVGGSGGSGGEQRGQASVRTERERELVRRAVGVMNSVGLAFQRCRLENDATAGRAPVWVYRMEPPLDILSTFETASPVPAILITATNPSDSSAAPQPPRIEPPNFTTRYAIRQVLEQECQKDALRRQQEARQKRWAQPASSSTSSRPLNANDRTAAGAGADNDDEDEEAASAAAEKDPKKSSGGGGGVKRDFFGRIIVNGATTAAASSGRRQQQQKKRERGEEDDTTACTAAVDENGMDKRRRKTAAAGRGAGAGKSDVWVSFHEGFSNAVRKPITLEELLRGL